MRITNKKITWIFIYKVEKSEANRSNTYVFLCGNPSTQLDGWMASLTRWTWVWVNSGSWWWTGRPGVLRFMGSQRVGHDWATDLIWSDTLNFSLNIILVTPPLSPFSWLNTTLLWSSSLCSQNILDSTMMCWNCWFVCLIHDMTSLFEGAILNFCLEMTKM